MASKSKSILVMYESDQEYLTPSSPKIKPLFFDPWSDFLFRHVLPVCAMGYSSYKILTIFNIPDYTAVCIGIYLAATVLTYILAGVYAAYYIVVEIYPEMSLEKNIRMVQRSFDNRYHATIFPGIPQIFKRLILGSKSQQQECQSQRKYDSKVAFAGEVTAATWFSSFTPAFSLRHNWFWFLITQWMACYVAVFVFAGVDGYESILHRPLFSILRVVVAALWFPIAAEFGRHMGFNGGLHTSAWTFRQSFEKLSKGGEDGKARLRMWVEDFLIEKAESEVVRRQKMELVVEPMMKYMYYSGLARCVPHFLPRRRRVCGARGQNGLYVAVSEHSVEVVNARKRSASSAW